MNKTDAIWTELYNAAKAVLKPRGVSSIIEAGRHAGRFDAGVVDIMAIRLILPDEANRQDVLNFYEKIERNGENCIGFANHADYDAWLIGMRNRKTGKNLPDGYVRENFYLCYDGDEMVGVFSLKFELTEYLLNYSGNIGYAVAPEKRRRGLATQILARGKAAAKELGFDRLLLVCDKDNIASEKTILANGGVYEDSRYDEEEGVLVKRFWIGCISDV